MIPIRKAAADFLARLLAEYSTKKIRNEDTVESIDERLAAYINGAPAKRATATSIRALITGGTITNPGVLTELTADATKLDTDADRYDAWATSLTPQLADSISFGQALSALLPGLEEINDVPEALGGFTSTAGNRPLKATTSSEATNKFVTLWRTPHGTTFDRDKAIHVETRAAVASTLYSFADAGAPAGDWDYYSAPLNAVGMPGSASGPMNVVVT